MRIASIDFETFWSAEHSLSKMTPMAYVTHPETEIISCAIKINDYPTDVFFGEDVIRKALHRLDWSDTCAIGHNMSGFDALVLSWRLGIHPRMWGCTFAMARPIHAVTVGGSLAKLVTHYRDKLEAMGIKGAKEQAILHSTKGRHLKDFTPEELADMKVYNRDDAEQCYGLFKLMRPLFSNKELWHIDATIRMLVEPKFDVNVPMLEAALCMERDQKRKHILQLARHLRKAGLASDAVAAAETIDDLEEAVRTELASAPKFSTLLESLDVEVPMKASPTNPDNQVPALAKTDEGFIALQEHENELVSAAARARLAVKSTLLETRIQKFLDTAALTNGKLPIPTNYCGAVTTGRRSGSEFNALNLPRVTPGKPRVADALRNCIKAPKGFKLVVADLSGIEMRFNHTLWQVPKSMKLWQESPTADLYKATASEMYGVPEDQVSKAQRQFAKVLHLACIQEGELVLTEIGLLPIEKVLTCLRVWDGVEWVHHDGPIYQGEQEVITYDSLTATPDHIVYLRDGSPCRFDKAANEGLEIARTGDGGTAIRASEDYVHGAGTGYAALQGAVPMRDLWGEKGYKPAQPETRHDQGLPEMQSAEAQPCMVGQETDRHEAAMHQPFRSSLSELRGSGDQVCVSERDGGGPMGPVGTGVEPASGTGSNRQRWGLCSGEPAVGDRQDADGQQTRRETHLKLQQDTNGVPVGAVCGRNTEEPTQARPVPGTDSCPVGPAVGQAKRRVWDLLNAGPRHRFTVSGKLVSNCGYGMGPNKFKDAARIMGGMTLTDDESAEGVAKWRALHPEIVAGWRKSGDALKDILSGVEVEVDPWGMFVTCREGFRLPSGRIIRYPDLRRERTADGKTEWWYGTGRHKARIYSGKCVENLCQGGSRDVMYDYILEVFKQTGARPSLEVYDEGVWVVPEAEAVAFLDTVQGIMRTPPKWFPALTTWSEGDVGDSYGQIK